MTETEKLKVKREAVKRVVDLQKETDRLLWIVFEGNESAVEDRLDSMYDIMDDLLRMVRSVNNPVNIDMFATPE